MNSGQVVLSIAAFMFLGTVLVNFNRLVLASNEDISSSRDLITATTIASTWIDEAQSLAFDQTTINSPVYDPATLTDPNCLGPDAGETDYTTFNDFDDFNGYSITQQSEGNNGLFESDFTVTYVDPENINFHSVQTFMKRLDIKTWRVDVPVTTDTVRMFTTMAYFKFN